MLRYKDLISLYGKARILFSGKVMAYHFDEGSCGKEVMPIQAADFIDSCSGFHFTINKN